MSIWKAYRTYRMIKAVLPMVITDDTSRSRHQNHCSGSAMVYLVRTRSKYDGRQRLKFGITKHNAVTRYANDSKSELLEVLVESNHIPRYAAERCESILKRRFGEAGMMDPAYGLEYLHPAANSDNAISMMENWLGVITADPEGNQFYAEWLSEQPGYNPPAAPEVEETEPPKVWSQEEREQFIDNSLNAAKWFFLGLIGLSGIIISLEAITRLIAR